MAVIFELFYQPNIDILKSTGGLTVVNVFGFTFLISEILIYAFIGVGILYVLEKIRRSGTISFGPKAFFPLPLLIFTLILVSFFAGISNSGFLIQVRRMLLPPLFYLIIINIDISDIWEKKYFEILVIGFIGLTAISLLDFFGLDHVFSFRKPQLVDRFGFRQLTMLTILPFNVAVAKLLFSKFSFKWLAISILCMSNIVLRLDLKSCFVGLLISCVFLFYFKIEFSRSGFKKVAIIASSVILIIVIIFSITPIQFKNKMARVVAWRYFQADIYTAEEFEISIFRSALTKDLSRTRFDVWKIYLIESLKGYGFAPYGFAYGDIFGLKIYEYGYTQGPHNLLVFFAFNSGILTALLLLALIIRYTYVNMLALTRAAPGSYRQFNREELIAVFCFSVSIIGTSMVEGSIRNLHVAFTFWLCVAILTRRSSILKTNDTRKLKNGYISMLSSLLEPIQKDSYHLEGNPNI